MGTYGQLVDLAVPTRRAAALLGLSRTTIHRKPAVPVDRAPVKPPNKLSTAERAETSRR
jgi:putative transposase